MHGAYWLLTKIGEAGETEWCALARRTARRDVALMRHALRRYVVPHKLGLYEFKCTVVGHENMKGILEVVP